MSKQCTCHYAHEVMLVHMPMCDDRGCGGGGVAQGDCKGVGSGSDGGSDGGGSVVVIEGVAVVSAVVVVVVLRVVMVAALYSWATPGTFAGVVIKENTIIARGSYIFVLGLQPNVEYIFW